MRLRRHHVPEAFQAFSFISLGGPHVSCRASPCSGSSKPLRALLSCFPEQRTRDQNDDTLLLLLPLRSSSSSTLILHSVFLILKLYSRSLVSCFCHPHITYTTALLEWHPSALLFQRVDSASLFHYSGSPGHCTKTQHHLGHQRCHRCQRRRLDHSARG